MNKERTGRCFTTRGTYLWSFAIQLFCIIKPGDDFSLTYNNPWFISVLLSNNLYPGNPIETNRIGGVIVNLLALSVIDRGFGPRSGQTKNY